MATVQRRRKMTKTKKQSVLKPDMIMQLGLGFWGSKTLLSAIELGLFTELAKGPLDAETIQERLSLHPRSVRDFLDTLVALRMLQRKGSRYANTPETDVFLDRNKPSYAGGMLEMCNARLYKFWGSLTEGLRTGMPQNEVKARREFFCRALRGSRQTRRISQSDDGIELRRGASDCETISLETVPDVCRCGLRTGRRTGSSRSCSPASHRRWNGFASRAADL